MERLYVFDTTLRDGEQSPGASMSVEQKYEFALQLASLGVDAIETGFPISSPIQWKACELIAKNIKGPVLTGLARAVEKDIDAVAQALKSAGHFRIHTFLATSPIHMQYKLGKTPEEVAAMAISSIKYARNLAPEVEFSPEDATRSELSFLIPLIEKAIDAGATVINIPDTVGYSTPDEFGAFIKAIREGVSNIDKAIISVHCHNDLGLAVANTLKAVINGARQIEVTVNGIGERAGNAALEEVVMAMEVRKDLLDFQTGIDTKQIYKTSRMLMGITGLTIPRNKPIVGENAFAHESGIHQDGVLKNRQTYEIMTPESVGRDSTSIVLGRHSGMHGFKKRIGELGFKLTDEEMKSIYERFLAIADRKKEVYDEDLFAIISDELGKNVEAYTLSYFNIISGNVSVPTATVRIVKDGVTTEEAATGDGPVDAIFKAIERSTGIKTTLKEYLVKAVTPGKQAIGEVSVTLDIDGALYRGRGSSTDILEASAFAFVNALNRYELLSQHAAEQEAL